MTDKDRIILLESALRTCTETMAFVALHLPDGEDKQLLHVTAIYAHNILRGPDDGKIVR